MTKVRRSITIDKQILEWIESQIKTKRFNNVSHAIEYAIYQLIKKEEEEREKP